MLFKMTLHLLAKAQYGDRQPQAHVLRTIMFTTTVELSGTEIRTLRLPN